MYTLEELENDNSKSILHWRKIFTVLNIPTAIPKGKGSVALAKYIAIDYLKRNENTILANNLVDTMIEDNRKQLAIKTPQSDDYVRIRVRIMISRDIEERDVNIQYKYIDNIGEYIRDYIPGAILYETPTDSDIISNFHTTVPSDLLTSNALDISSLDDMYFDLDDSAFGEETIFANDDNTCVTEFCTKYGIDMEKYHFYDGMKAKDFINNCTQLNIRVLNNEFIPCNKVSTPIFETLLYDGHVYTELLHNKQTSEPTILNDNDFDNMYDQAILDKSHLLSGINVCDGVCGKILYRFRYNDNLYQRAAPMNAIQPTELIPKLLEDYECPFRDDNLSNMAIYYGVALPGDKHIDDTASFVSSFRELKQIPMITNTRINEADFKYIDSNARNWFVSVNSFVLYRDIVMPPTIYRYDEILRYRQLFKSTIIVNYGYHVEEYKPIDANDIFKTSEAIIEANYKDSKYAHYHELAKNKSVDVTRNKYVEAIWRFAFGKMISKRVNNYRIIYDSYLKDIMADTKNRTIQELNQLTPKYMFLQNVYAMMSVRYRFHMLRLTMTHKVAPSAIFCDSLYFNENEYEVIADQIPSHFHIEDDVAIRKDCKKMYFPKHGELYVIAGLAGSGKTTSLKNRLANDKANTLVITNSYRLQKVWEGFTVLPWEYIKSRHHMPLCQRIVIDEVYQMNPQSVSEIIACANYYNIITYLVGDPHQLPPVNISQQAALIHKLRLQNEIMRDNWRNSIDYTEIFNAKSSEDRQRFFDKYMETHMCTEHNDGVVYCYNTNEDDENSTRNRNDKFYREYVEQTHPSTVYYRCTKTHMHNDIRYCVNELYPVTDNDYIKNSSKFTISNCYSLYATQGMTLASDNYWLLVDDYDIYTSANDITYTIVSRLSE